MSIFLNEQRTKEAMFTKGYNVSSLASKTGVSVTHMSLIVNNKRKPSPKLAQKMAQTLGVEISDIFVFGKGLNNHDATTKQ
ncbi:helix-turn-helix transcriptional regulator [Staphylococcus pseudintermedius]|uniref:helix-turn-helix transcriptional regulator n=1 Tax=Staphylococcus pseudintermedius TaxID=283734 RepID=UPI00397FDDD8